MARASEEKKNSFVLYYSDGDLFDILSDKQAGQVIKSIFAFARDGVDSTEDFKGSQLMLYKIVSEHIARDTEKYLAMCQTNKDNGSKGGRPQKGNPGNEGTDSDNKTTVAGTNVPPTLDEVKIYFEVEPESPVDAETFFYNYESIGWMQGNKKISNWQSLAMKWERQEGYSRGCKYMTVEQANAWIKIKSLGDEVFVMALQAMMEEQDDPKNAQFTDENGFDSESWLMEHESICANLGLDENPK